LYNPSNELDNSLTGEEISHWVSADANDPGHQIYSDTDVIREVTQESHDDTLDINDEDDERDVQESVAFHGKAKQIRDLAHKKIYSNLTKLA